MKLCGPRGRGERRASLLMLLWLGVAWRGRAGQRGGGRESLPPPRPQDGERAVKLLLDGACVYLRRYILFLSYF
ncbi:hypothetical protein RR46_00864 [Papilio xuthus]|uniref:Uncharacterized protein n=1 Tax=Papilio xuthus TaxID=66420 RepID=A0A0N1I2X4_PAPXU|nr:hypothetical protein RR46_00864 [Papilio xuthus]